jgi:hypothetical protein
MPMSEPRKPPRNESTGIASGRTVNVYRPPDNGSADAISCGDQKKKSDTVKPSNPVYVFVCVCVGGSYMGQP